jgi:predicted NBD/HSP70 family sugar kinase
MTPPPVHPNLRNRRQILKLIRTRGEASRAELSKLTGLTRPTISTVVSELLAAGLVMETGKGSSSGGKRPILLKLRPDCRYAIGIDLADEYQIRGVLCDLTGQVVRHKNLTYSNRFESIFTALRQLITLLRQGDVCGVGIAVSGLLDAEHREIVSSSNFDIAGRNLAGRLQKLFNLPILLEKRPNAAAFAEKHAGCALACKSLVYMTSGRGVGAGIIVDGKIFRGSFGAAGEIGQMQMPFEPEPEFTGASRALEDLTRDSALTDMISNAKDRPLKYQEILDLYQAGDPDAVRIFRKNARFLACAAQVMSNLLNPEAVVLGGRAPELGERYLNDFREYFHDGGSSADTQVLYSMFGRHGSARGGAMTVLDRVYNFTL